MTKASQFGTRFVIDGRFGCPDGGDALLRSVWFIEADGVSPRLVTAHPVRSLSP